MLVAALAALAALVTGAVPAGAAGGWAATYMDPLPGRFAAGTPYALGFWVLQHGNHPFEGDLGAVGLRLTRAEDGRRLTFGGTRLPEAGHYATSVVAPEGTWKVEGVQGLFSPHHVGTLTVPGGLRLEPARKEVVEAFVNLGRDYWDAVRPPGFPDLPGGKVTVGDRTAASDAGPPTAPPATAAPRATGASVAAPAHASGDGSAGGGSEAGGMPAYTLLLAAAGGALVAVVGLRLLPRPGGRAGERDDGSEGPTDSSSETIVISG